MKLLIGLLMIAILLIGLGPIYVEATKEQKGSKTYTVPDEFSFKYPSNWELQERENRFSDMDARLIYGRFNDVQMTFQGGNKNESGLSGSDNDLVDTMGTMITTNFEDGSLFENSSNKYTINNQNAPYVIGTYTGGWSTDLRTGEETPIEWAVMLVAVPLTEDQRVLVGYTTEIDDFDRYLPKAEQVIKSITPINSTGTTDTF